MLAHQWHRENGLPVVFLHGLLGSQQDWAEVLARLSAYSELRPLTLDLPFHGASCHISCQHLDEAYQLLQQTLQQLLGNQPFWLVGYSLGGRLALYYALNSTAANLQGVILEGVNIGLVSVEEKQQRWQHDRRWAARFRHEPITEVLADWYQQPVFAHLTDSERRALVGLRAKNRGENIAKMLEATSLAKQPWLLPPQDARITFLVGEQDPKFRHLAEQYCLTHHLIPHAGHNSHRENPAAFVKQMIACLQPG